MSRADTYALGLWGEAQVADYLKTRGQKMLALRWRCPYGELDLVTEAGPYLCFVEVKLRQNEWFAPARAFVTAGKQRKLRLAAQQYLVEHPSGLQPRFDVAEVYAPLGVETKNPRIIYWENAF